MVYFLLLGLFLMTGCKGVTLGESLLSSGDLSCNNEISNCNTTTPPLDPSGLSVQAVSNEMTLNIDQSDILEVTGSCNDQGKKKNRIIVDVFAGDQDETVDPYISNSIMSNCYNLLQSGNTSSGIPYGQKCFWVTKGKGLIEDAGLPSQKDFPQCHNGQFGFAVKLGKILTDNTLGIKYLIRYKIRTEDGTIVDSTWNRVTVTRQLSTPKIETPTPSVGLKFSCDLNSSIARFNQNISYTMNRTYNLDGGGVSPAAPLPLFINLTSVSSLAYKHTDLNMVEGVTYNYSLTATETQYAPYAPGPNPSKTSPSVTCKIDKPILNQWLAPNSGTGTCYINIVQANYNTDVKYYVARSTQANWTAKGSAITGDPHPCNAGGIQTGNCQLSGLLPSNSATHYIAVRPYRDSNGNNNPDANEEIGEWSNETPCKP